MTICAVCLLTTSVCARQTFYKTCVGLFLLFGLVLTSLSLTVFYDIPQLNLGLHLHRHRSITTHQIFSGRLNILCRDIFAEEYEGKQQQADTQSMASTQTEQTQLCPG